jgi:hypothetical protein
VSPPTRLEWAREGQLLVHFVDFEPSRDCLEAMVSVDVGVVNGDSVRSEELCIGW